VTQTAKPGPGRHVVTDVNTDHIMGVIPSTDPNRPPMTTEDYRAHVRRMLGLLDQVPAELLTDEDEQTPNERLLNEIFAAPACAAVEMGLGCAEAATWTAVLTCCQLRELCCDTHHAGIAGSRRDVVCTNCNTPGRMGRLITFTPYTGSTR
jgi:hypothetical protein